MQIGELAAEVGVSTKTIRYYEDIELLPEPERASNGYREYGQEAVGRLKFIRDAQDTGLTLTEIASILDLRSRGEGTCHHVVNLLEQHLEGLDRHIETLHQTRDQLAALTERSKALDPRECTDPNRCQTIDALSDDGSRPRASNAHVHSAPHSHSHH